MRSNDLPNKHNGATEAIQKAHRQFGQLEILDERREAAG